MEAVEHNDGGWGVHRASSDWKSFPSPFRLGTAIVVSLDQAPASADGANASRIRTPTKGGKNRGLHRSFVQIHFLQITLLEDLRGQRNPGFSGFQPRPKRSRAAGAETQSAGMPFASGCWTSFPMVGWSAVRFLFRTERSSDMLKPWTTSELTSPQLRAKDSADIFFGQTTLTLDSDDAKTAPTRGSEEALDHEADVRPGVCAGARSTMMPSINLSDNVTVSHVCILAVAVLALGAWAVSGIHGEIDRIAGLVSETAETRAETVAHATAQHLAPQMGELRSTTVNLDASIKNLDTRFSNAHTDIKKLIQDTRSLSARGTLFSMGGRVADATDSCFRHAIILNDRRNRLYAAPPNTQVVSFPPPDGELIREPVALFVPGSGQISADDEAKRRAAQDFFVREKSMIDQASTLLERARAIHAEVLAASAGIIDQFDGSGSQAAKRFNEICERSARIIDDVDGSLTSTREVVDRALSKLRR
jgi:hypothetical protein